GATITAIELPTAFPYFAAIAAVVGSGLNRGQEIGLLLVFNVCFVAPLLGILATLVFAGSHADRALGVGRRFLERFWPHMLAILILIVGVVAVLVGVSGLAAAGHGGVGRFFRHVRHFFHLHPR
ncbi:MAG TPA: GAP family protein, partial [Solirubrobacteraceae bacterium]|nr:GAP family protein [Solirubrobacteraceae bacterium]